MSDAPVVSIEAVVKSFPFDEKPVRLLSRLMPGGGAGGAPKLKGELRTAAIMSYGIVVPTKVRTPPWPLMVLPTWSMWIVTMSPFARLVVLRTAGVAAVPVLVSLASIVGFVL